MVGYSGSTERKLVCVPEATIKIIPSRVTWEVFNMSGDETMAWDSANQNSQQGRWRIGRYKIPAQISVETTNGSGSISPTGK